MAERRTLKLALIGSAAGLFSGIFGVGGGSVIVPALVLSLGYNQREAAGTSLLAITMIAAFAAALQAGYGNVHVLDGVLIGAPVARVVPHRTLALVFSAVLLAASVELILE